MPDIICLQSLLPGVPLLCREETSSTNTDARDWLLRGASHGSLIMADRQTTGRGRMGRSFASAEGGLYMSIVLRTNQPAGILTTLCAVAVRRAVKELTGLPLDIKWVNDLLLKGKKVCGILCEGVWSGVHPLGFIAGIGVNISQTAFPEALRDIAASLFPDGKCGIPREHFAASIHREVLSLLPQAPVHMAEYRDCCLTLGRTVQWRQEGRQFEGKALDVDETGALLVETSQGRILLAAGEVSIKVSSAFDAAPGQ